MSEQNKKVLDDPLLTRKEAAEVLRVSPQTLAQWSCNKKHTIPTVKYGKKVLYRLSDLKKFIKEHTIA